MSSIDAICFDDGQPLERSKTTQWCAKAKELKEISDRTGAERWCKDTLKVWVKLLCLSVCCLKCRRFPILSPAGCWLIKSKHSSPLAYSPPWSIDDWFSHTPSSCISTQPQLMKSALCTRAYLLCLCISLFFHSCLYYHKSKLSR